MERLDFRFCPACGTPASTVLPVKHEDAIGQFAHHESVLQNYRSMFLMSETFSVSVAATRLDDRGLALLFAAFGLSWLVVWIIVTTLRARVVEFFEKHDNDGGLMQYHHLVEGVAPLRRVLVLHRLAARNVCLVLVDSDPPSLRVIRIG